MVSNERREYEYKKKDGLIIVAQKRVVFVSVHRSVDLWTPADAVPIKQLTKK